MALEAGDAVKGTGLAGALAAARKKAFPNYSPAKDRAINYEAEAIIKYLIENAEVVVTEVPGGTTLDPPGIGNLL